ncbi:MAG: type II secretion system F family protein [Planctomycetota bacterium]|nr:type II secretion system F family protein [Planctomycetota bacterium]
MNAIFQDSLSSTVLWFVIGLGVALPSIMLVLRRRTQATLDLDAVRDPAFADLSTFEPDRPMFLGSFTLDLAGEPIFKAPAELRAEMLRAGWYHARAAIEYRAARNLLTMGGLFTVLGILAISPPSTIPFRMLAGGGFVIMLMSLPRLYLGWAISSHSSRLEKEMPLALELLALGGIAGQTLQLGLEHAARELCSSHRAVARDLAIVSAQAKLGGLSMALRAWSERQPLPIVRNLCQILDQGLQLGSEVSTNLVDYASSQGAELRQKAMGRAARASFWLLIPSVFCLWVAAMIVMVGPTYLEFTRGRSATARNLQKQIQSVGNNVKVPVVNNPVE